MQGYNYENLFIFSGLSISEFNSLISTYPPKIEEYQKGELILSEEKNPRTLGFVLDGECEVRRKRNGTSSVILNLLGPSSSFGILSVFSAESFPTEIYARKNTAVMFFSKETVLKMIEMNSKIAMNVIGFLSNKILFLNKKIATFSESSVENKLFFYLSEIYQREGTPFLLNCKKCSEILGVGRASVYRGLKSLEEEGLIIYKNKKIYILKDKILERN